MLPPRKRYGGRLATLLAIVVLATGIGIVTMSFVIRQFELGSSDSVEVHHLFEVTAKALAQAGRVVKELRSLNASTIKQTKYGDIGAVELHTAADQGSSDVLARMQAIIPGLVMVDEERVTEPGQFPAATRRSRALRTGIGADASRPAGLNRQMLPLSELAVYVDPLDATQEYSEGLTQYVSLSACITRCGKPIAGLVYLPFSDKLYWTRPGTGVHVNFDVDTALMVERSLLSGWEGAEGVPASCCMERSAIARGQAAADAAAAAAAAEGGDSSGSSSHSSVHSEVAPDGVAAEIADAWKRGLRVVMSRSHRKKATNASSTTSSGSSGSKSSSSKSGATGDQQLAAVAAARGAGTPTVIRAGGAGYKLTELLEGHAEVYAHDSNIRKWDVCAGAALIQAAGGRVTDWSGAEINYCVPNPPPGAAAAAAAAAAGGDTKAAAAAATAAFTVQGILGTAYAALHDQIQAGLRELQRG